MSQIERVLAMLRAAGRDGLCSLDLYRSYLPNGRNRIGELEHERRFEIGREWCHHEEQTPPHVRYRLDYDPERQPVQSRMAI